MRTGSWVFLGVVLLASGAGVSACSSSSGGSSGGSGGSGAEGGACDGAGCGDGGEAQVHGTPHPNGDAGSGGAPDEPGPPACVPVGKGDSPDDAFEDSNCDGIDGDKSKAVFVSPDGDDGFEGVFGSPVKTLGKAVELASDQSKDVYVCVGEYADGIVIDTKPVSIFGGYGCADWSRSNARPKVAPSAGVPLTVKNASGVTIDRMAFESAVATTPGESSVAVLVVTSADVHLSHAQVDAGDGAPGVSGAATTAVTKAAKSGADGQDSAACNLSLDGCKQAQPKGGSQALMSCGATSVRGGFGGAGATKLINPPLPGMGLGGLPGALKSGADAGPARPGKAGAPGAVGFGAVDVDGYSPANAGADGAIGQVGDSGGGGDGGLACNYYDWDASECQTSVSINNSYSWWGGGGGQGGYGGCGGAGGHGGGGGGASIAVLSLNSTLAISWASLSTATGGVGGAPSDGSLGQSGGAGGKGGKPAASNLSSFRNVTAGQDGGYGADGGKGGPGGPGAGGPSITIVALGDVPITQAVTLTPGAGGKGAVGLDGKDATSGESADVKVVPVPAASDGT